MKYEGINDEYFEVLDVSAEACSVVRNIKHRVLALIWFTSDGNELTIDSIRYTFNKNDIVCLTEFHKVEIHKAYSLRLLRFNRPFFCILDHDTDIGCKGVLYFGASKLPLLRPVAKDVEALEAVWKVLCIEMESKDNLQLEMLQMLLKRILILCTRIYRKQESFTELDEPGANLVREFNFLVEKHFREKHAVSNYAEMLNRSPKTLSNVFKKLSDKTPLQFIKERLMLEARRLLSYTDKTVSEIGYEIGFPDVQAFSRFFKTQEGVAPLDFRNDIAFAGKIANTLGNNV